MPVKALFALLPEREKALGFGLTFSDSSGYDGGMKIPAPDRKPRRPYFGSGPCAKFAHWKPDSLREAPVGRSHRSREGLSRIEDLLRLSRDILRIPPDYEIALVPGSDTGAVEMLLWNLLGARAVDVFYWESFGKQWAKDITEELNLQNTRLFGAERFGSLPDLSLYRPENDLVFTYNGTTSGVCVPDLNFIPESRTGLSICDATSAVFSMDIDWTKLDAATFSWQKTLGGEAAHGQIILSPRALDRLKTYRPSRPVPKLFQMKKGKEINTALFRGRVINTPSLLAVEDALFSLKHIQKIGGLKQSIALSQKNLESVTRWISRRSPYFDFLAETPETRSCTSVCLKIKDPLFQKKPREQQQEILQKISLFLEENRIAYDINAYRDAPPGLRLWGGCTVENTDTEALLPWLDYAYEKYKD